MNNVRKIWESCNIAEKFPQLAASVLFNEPMSFHTTFRTGGPVDLFAKPHNTNELEALLSLFLSEGVPVWITGGGSNLVVSDRGLAGVCVSISGFQTLAVNEKNTQVTAGAGVLIDTLVAWCAERGLSGVEKFAGLPGTVGGAVYMNARCYDCSISDVFCEADVLFFRNGGYTVETIGKNSSEWGYKQSPFQKISNTGAGNSGIVETGAIEPARLAVILSASFSVLPGDPHAIRTVMQTCVSDREAKGHFRFPSAGSMFKNNRTFGKPTGKIIDEAGLRGTSIGDAQVAPWHGNLVINKGNASSADIRALVEHVQKIVFKKTGFVLEPEVVFVGEW